MASHGMSGIGLGDVVLNEGERLAPFEVLDVVWRTGDEIIQDDYGVAAVEQRIAQVRANESGAPCKQDLHGVSATVDAGFQVGRKSTATNARVNQKT